MTTVAAIAPPTLETPRLVLRPLNADDAAPMTDLADDREVARMTTSIPHPFSQAMADAFIARMARRDARHEIALAVEHRREGFIGVLGFHPNEGPSSELGYWIGRPYWGQGYMTEAVLAAVDWARAGWKKRLLVSGHFADNPASGQVLCKAGFLYTGEVRERFSVARDAPATTRMMVWLG
ncbi:MAG: GNAT family N-acetyltransferase [Caulobacteraceae bacterium]|nr:GNAT family N-acetyltransferase [Caulobacteraceae bacterium]